MPLLFPKLFTLVRDSFRLSFLFRKDVIVLLLAGFALSCASGTIDQLIAGGVLHPSDTVLDLWNRAGSEGNQILFWLLDLAVVRSALTQASGFALIRPDVAAWKSFALITPGIISSLVPNWDLSNLKRFVPSLLAYPVGGRVFYIVLVLVSVYITFLWTRAFTLPDIAWKSGGSDWRISAGWRLMRGRTWRVLIGGMVCVFPLIILQQNFGYVLPKVLSGKLSSALSPPLDAGFGLLISVIAQNFTIRVYRALALSA